MEDGRGLACLASAEHRVIESRMCRWDSGGLGGWFGDFPGDSAKGEMKGGANESNNRREVMLVGNRQAEFGA